MGRTKGWVVGRVAGAPVVVSPGWLVAAVVLTVAFAPTARVVAPTAGDAVYLVSGAFVLLLLVSVFLHELAHALVARRRGVVVEELAVTLLGGHTRFGHAAPTPATSTLVAVAGPTVNLALGAGAWALSTVLPLGVPRALALAAAVANGFVGAFNLVPGLPLDGGRVLEAAVWAATGDRSRGTLAAGRVGRLVAVGVVAWVVLEPLADGRAPSTFGVLWGVLVGGFLWTGAGAAIRASRVERAVGTVDVRSLVAPAVALGPGASVADADALPSGHEALLTDAGGRPVGWVDRAALAAVPRGVRATTPLAAVVVPLAGQAVDVRLTGEAALRALAAAAAGGPVVPVVDAVGGVVGLVRSVDVVRVVRDVREGRTGGAPGSPPFAGGPERSPAGL